MKHTHYITMQRFAAVALAAAAALMGAGCQVVHVIDRQGQPIAGVNITSQYVDEAGDAGEGPAGTTDSFGNAHLARPVFKQLPLWMTLGKRGYMPQGIDYPSQWYVTVVMDSIGPTTP